jgi:hypothetical protein
VCDNDESDISINDCPPITNSTRYQECENDEEIEVDEDPNDPFHTVKYRIRLASKPMINSTEFVQISILIYNGTCRHKNNHTEYCGPLRNEERGCITHRDCIPDSNGTAGSIEDFSQYDCVPRSKAEIVNIDPDCTSFSPEDLKSDHNCNSTVNKDGRIIKLLRFNLKDFDEFKEVEVRAYDDDLDEWGYHDTEIAEQLPQLPHRTKNFALGQQCGF